MSILSTLDNSVMTILQINTQFDTELYSSMNLGGFVTVGLGWKDQFAFCHSPTQPELKLG